MIVVVVVVVVGVVVMIVVRSSDILSVVLCTALFNFQLSPNGYITIVLWFWLPQNHLDIIRGKVCLFVVVLRLSNI